MTTHSDKNRQPPAQTGHHPDRNRHMPDSPRHIRRTPRGKIGQIAATLFLLFMASCGTVERVSTEREVSVEHKELNVPVPGHVQTWPFSAADLPQSADDTLQLTDDRVRLTITTQRQVERNEATRSEVETPGAGTEFVIGNYLLQAEILPDTLTTTVPETTITERTETTVTETKTGRLAWITIGGLLAVVIILILAFQLTQNRR